MPFFKKKQKQEPQNPEPLGTSSEEQYAPLPSTTDSTSYDNSSAYASSSSNAVNPQLAAKIEKLSAEIEAGAEIRTVYDERFARIEGQLGELREMIVDREKDIEELEVKAVKASDLVLEVQPEKILSEVKKNDIRIDSVKAKLDSFESMNETLMEEIKKMRQTVQVFRGTEEIVELNKEVRQEIFGIQKIKADVERHADKVESMYGETSKKFDDFKKYRDEAKNLEEQFGGFEKQFNELKLRVLDQVSREDFIKLSNELEARSSELTHKITQINTALQKAQELEQLTQRANILLTNMSSGQSSLGQNSQVQNPASGVSGFDQSTALSLNLQLDNINKIKNELRSSKFEIELLKGEISELKKTKTGPQINLFGKTNAKTENFPQDTSNFVKKEELQELQAQIQKINTQQNSSSQPQTTTIVQQISPDYIKKAEMDEIIRNMNQRIEFVTQQKVNTYHVSQQNSQKNELTPEILNQMDSIRNEVEAQKADVLNYLADVKKGQQSQSERHAQLTMLFEFQTNKLKSLTDKSKKIEEDIRAVADSISGISSYRKEQRLAEEKDKTLSEKIDEQAKKIAQLHEEYANVRNEIKGLTHDIKNNDVTELAHNYEKLKTDIHELLPVIQSIGRNKHETDKIKDAIRILVRQFANQKEHIGEELKGLRHRALAFEDAKEKLEINIYELTKDLERVRIETKNLSQKFGDTTEKQLLLQYFTEKTKDLEHKFKTFEHSIHKQLVEQSITKGATSSADIEELKNKITDDLEIRENINIRIGNLERKYSTLSEIMSKLVVLINQLSEKEN